MDDNQTYFQHLKDKQTKEMALLAPSTDDLDLTSLPDRLDDEMLARVQLISRLPLPPQEPVSDRHFNQCLRIMLSVLPKRSSDEVSGELFVAAYQRMLGHYSASQISHIADRAMRQCKWFPTISECIDMLDDWRRNDEHTARQAEARNIAANERGKRMEEEREAEKVFRVEPEDLPQDVIDCLSPELVRIGLSLKALMHDENGKVVAWKPKLGEAFNPCP